MKIFQTAVLALFLTTTLGAQDGDTRADSNDTTVLFERFQALSDEMRALESLPQPTLGILQERREQQARELQDEADRLEQEIHIAVTGVDDGEYQAVFEAPPTDLKAELFEFLEPFLLLLRSATAESREIEGIRRELQGLEEQKSLATRALEELDGAEERVDVADGSRAMPDFVADARATWSDRLAANSSRAAVLEAKLERIRSGPDEAVTISGPATFLRERAWGLLLGLSAGAATWLLLVLIGNLANRAFRNRRLAELGSQGIATAGLSRQIGARSLGVPVRAVRLLYRFVAAVAGFVVALAVFNARNDWLLLGLGVILLLGFVWTLVKSLPDAMDQIRTMLNLGAVQEGERLMFDGVPWLVSHLDFHTTLVNPQLEGGDLSLPVRDLSGLHSRPVAPEEDWFPTSKGDWVLLDDDKIAQVEVQTPGSVRLRRLGGGTLVIPSPAFVESAPMNLSNGFRVGARIRHRLRPSGRGHDHSGSSHARLPEGTPTRVFARGCDRKS